MSITISAVFDHPDAADLAVAELNRNGVPVQAFKAYDALRRPVRDTQSEEVFARITLDDSQAETAQAMLISAGGRQVRAVMYTAR